MPVYTYRCSNCGVQFEKQQSFTDQSLIRCPECGKRALKKVFLPVGIVFKGSGFYATDHHSPSGQASSKAIDKEAEKTGDKVDKGDKDTKEASQPESKAGSPGPATDKKE